MTSAMWPDNAVEPSGVANRRTFDFEMHISQKVIHKKRSLASKKQALYLFFPPLNPVNLCSVVLPTADNPLCRLALRTDNSLKALGLPPRPVPLPAHLQVPLDCRPAVRMKENTISSRWSWKQRPLQASRQAPDRPHPVRNKLSCAHNSEEARSGGTLKVVGHLRQSRPAFGVHQECLMCE